MQWTQHGGESKELELELLLSHMTQKPMLRGEVGARALRVRSDVRGHGQARLCKAKKERARIRGREKLRRGQKLQDLSPCPMQWLG